MKQERRNQIQAHNLKANLFLNIICSEFQILRERIHLQKNNTWLKEGHKADNDAYNLFFI